MGGGAGGGADRGGCRAGGRWGEPLGGSGARGAYPEARRLHRHVSGLVHPSLDETLPDGVELPVGLAGASSLVLAAPTLRPHLVVGGVVASLEALVTHGVRPGGKAPAAEVTAEALAEAKSLMPCLGAVLDGTLWGLEAGATGQTCVARNVLLAGSDPVAVDAVALRLAGVDPLRVPWLRLCVQRGLGHGEGDSLQVVGRRDLLDLDFGLRGDTFAAGKVSSLGGPVGRWRRRRSADSARETGWAALCEG